ncbi:hypothetical protein CXG81DRAFT_19829 [Caulochytrium protostelioides]|uniref:Uncharacterized protein n=1 Tax=Caulochytrium protostelioides TaxID=1555241 RepID=A0A4P9X4Y5_9FUNG|nr:hypothetical protein CXG81DRAFT_19829 [Caulochytrium protostelioides]|eukprot:RKP00167.1 hypothetical protein CXG81DRAFT_19829 [Caulochytrium protostelioides]
MPGAVASRGRRGSGPRHGAARGPDRHARGARSDGPPDRGARLPARRRLTDADYLRARGIKSMPLRAATTADDRAPPPSASASSARAPPSQKAHRAAAAAAAPPSEDGRDADADEDDGVSVKSEPVSEAATAAAAAPPARPGRGKQKKVFLDQSSALSLIEAINQKRDATIDMKVTRAKTIQRVASQAATRRGLKRKEAKKPLEVIKEQLRVARSAKTKKAVREAVKQSEAVQHALQATRAGRKRVQFAA